MVFRMVYEESLCLCGTAGNISLPAEHVYLFSAMRCYLNSDILIFCVTVFSCKRMYFKYSVSKWLSTLQEQALYRLLCVILELISERRVAALLSVDGIFSFFIFLMRLKVLRLITLFIQTKSYSSLFCQ